MWGWGTGGREPGRIGGGRVTGGGTEKRGWGEVEDLRGPEAGEKRLLF